MPAQTTSLSAVSTTDSALSMPLLLQPEVGGLVDPLSVNRPNQSSRSLLFVDSGVADYQMLVAGVSASTEVYILDSSQDAVTQITNTLLGRNDISSLHIVSHGEAGELSFGTGKLNLSDLPEYAAQLQSWGKALTDDADILLYGCNVAQGELGKAFTSILSQLTGADIAASDDLTGSIKLGGDWDLEVQTGLIETAITFQPSILVSYKATLGVLFSDGFANNAAGWTLGNEWQIGSATASSGGNGGGNPDPATDTTPTFDNGVAGVVIGGNASTALHDFYYLTSPVINTNVIEPVNLQFQRWLNSDYTPYMQNVIEVYNGSSWARVWASGGSPGIKDNAWSLQTYDITPYKSSNMQVRFGFNVAQSGVFTIGSWNIDDVTIATSNAAPTLTLPTAGSTVYTENSNAVVLDTSATITDSDSTNFDTGTLTVNFSANGTGDDSLFIRDQGTAAGEIGVSGSNITFGGIQIGTFTGGMGTTPLVVTFNSSSSPDAAQALLRNLAYSNVSEAPSTVDRTISLVLTDGDGGTSATANKTITVVAVNDAPTVTAPATIAVTEDITTTITGISFADPDAGNSIVTATLTVGAGTLGATSGGGVTVGGIATNRTLSGTLAAINSFITGNNLTYTTDLNATATQALSVSLNDGGNTGTGGALTSAVSTVALNVTAVNDVPTVAAPAAIAVIEDTVSALAGITFADVDASNDSVTATFTVGAGTLAATSGDGVTVGGTAISRTLSGTITAINSFIGRC